MASESGTQPKSTDTRPNIKYNFSFEIHSHTSRSNPPRQTNRFCSLEIPSSIKPLLPLPHFNSLYASLQQWAISHYWILKVASSVQSPYLKLYYILCETKSPKIFRICTKSAVFFHICFPFFCFSIYCPHLFWRTAYRFSGNKDSVKRQLWPMKSRKWSKVKVSVRPKCFPFTSLEVACYNLPQKILYLDWRKTFFMTIDHKQEILHLGIRDSFIKFALYVTSNNWKTQTALFDTHSVVKCRLTCSS